MKHYMALFAVALLVLGAGCQLLDNTPTAPVSPADNNSTGIDLDAEYGGLTTTSEAPAFGEPEAYQPLLDQESNVEDPYQYDFEVQNFEKATGARIYRFRAVWGHLSRLNQDSTTTDFCPLDWTGKIQAQGGIVIIEKVIAFDKNDMIKRVNRSTVEWISNTGPHIDGVQLKIIFPPSTLDSTNVSSETMLRQVVFETKPFTRTFTIDELDSLNILEPVDRCGNGIAIASYRIHPYKPHGHLMGQWQRVPTDTIYNADSTAVRGVLLGVYRGIWYSTRGLASGYLRGIFGINSSGEKVFFGKYIDLNGRFMGILKGHYGDSDEETTAEFPCGWFRGIWVGKYYRLEGKLHGHWIADAEGHGYFMGNWKSDGKK